MLMVPGPVSPVVGRTAPARPRPARAWWVLAHRWAGLTIAAFLIVAGLTGSVIAWEEPLTLATRPDAGWVTPPRPGARPLDGVTIAGRVERATGAAVGFVPLAVPRDRVVRLFVAPRPGGAALPYDVVWADPYTGAVRLTYRWGGLRDGAVNIVPLLYSLHYGIVAGPWGEWAFGVAALVWTVDCFVGLFLTFPVRRVPRRGAGRWLARWRPAWRVRRAGGYKLTVDLHRAGGLWLWLVLLVFAWSGVALALPQVELPVRRALGGAPSFAPPALARPLATPPLGRRAAVASGAAALAARGWAGVPTGLSFDPASGLYTLYARTRLDPTDAGGATAVWIDGASGRVVHVAAPAGGTRADAAAHWLEWLHMAQVFGLPWRLAVTAIGLAVTALSVTGVMIWLRKRSAQLLAARRRPARGS